MGGVRATNPSHEKSVDPLTFPIILSLALMKVWVGTFAIGNAHELGDVRRILLLAASEHARHPGVVARLLALR